MDAYNFARQLMRLNCLTPCEYVAKLWASELHSLILNLIN